MFKLPNINILFPDKHLKLQFLVKQNSLYIQSIKIKNNINTSNKIAG